LNALPVATAAVCVVAVLLPAAMSLLTAPTEAANALGPNPTATLDRLLVQPEPALMPLIDAHVAPAVPAPFRAATASAPDATAPSRHAPMESARARSRP
jgi:hypothetical protein